MARTPGQRGRIGNWLVESRLARGWETQEKARSEVQRLTGWKIPASVYAEWESGRRIPSDANLARLEEFYGSGPGQKVAATSDDPVAAAIREQTEAIKEQTRTLLEALRSRDSTLEGLLHELGSYRQVQGGLVETLVAALEQSRGVDPADDPAPAPRGAARR